MNDANPGTTRSPEPYRALRFQPWIIAVHAVIVLCALWFTTTQPALQGNRVQSMGVMIAGLLIGVVGLMVSRQRGAKERVLKGLPFTCGSVGIVSAGAGMASWGQVFGTTLLVLGAAFMALSLVLFVRVLSNPSS